MFSYEIVRLTHGLTKVFENPWDRGSDEQSQSFLVVSGWQIWTMSGHDENVEALSYRYIYVTVGRDIL